jgi:hypothetical protein
MIGQSPARLISARLTKPLASNLLVVDDDAGVRDLMVRLNLDSDYSGRTSEHVDLLEVSFGTHPSTSGNTFNAPLEPMAAGKGKEYLAQNSTISAATLV